MKKKNKLYFYFYIGFFFTDNLILKLFFDRIREVAIIIAIITDK